MTTWVVMSDLQIPFQDRQALEVALRFVEDLRPHGVILNGDVVDCYTISDYSKDPLHPETLQDEIDQAGSVMARLARVTKERIWLGGNHEDRLRRYIWQHAPAFSDLGDLQFPQLFRVQQYGFVYRPYGAFAKLGKLVVTHGSLVRKHSGISAKAHFEKYGTSVLHGHTHRLGAYFHTNLAGPHVAYEGGCLCRLNPEYVQHPDWQQGVAVVQVNESSRFFHVQLVPILGRKVLFYGDAQYGPHGRHPA